MLVSIAESNGLSKSAVDSIKELTYSDAELDAVLEKFINALNGDTIVDYVAENLNKIAVKCNITLDYEVHDEIGLNTLIRKSAGLN